MMVSNGKILMLFGIIHAVFAVSPFAFGGQFLGFSDRLFFRISDGLLEFPLGGGPMNYANFAAFWFFYFGLLLIPVGILVNHLEREWRPIPGVFCWVYLVVVLVGVYMIPLSGMTLLMLPHAIYMLLHRHRQGGRAQKAAPLT